MRVPASVFATPAAMGRLLAEEIAAGIGATRRQGRPYVLGCPGGRSAVPTYEALAVFVTRLDLDLGHVVIAMMDDYVEADGHGGFDPIDDRLHHSCRHFGSASIVGPLNAAARRGRRMPTENLWLPDPRDPEAYDAALRDAGGVDLFILASGATDGHVAFNPAGSEITSRTRVVALEQTTRQDNVATFPFLGSVDQVPHFGVTVGIATIVEMSKRAVMVVHGSDKTEAAARLLVAEQYKPDWPATVIVECRRPALYLDETAARRSATV
ncbi:MAG: 6-phosphogluconolactonase [Mycobacteriales bacterium]